MKRVTQGGDINFNVTDVKGLGENYAFRFYTTDSNRYIVKVDGDADEGIIRLEWDELKTLGDGVLCYYADNLEQDEEYSDGTFNRTFGGTTQWYIVTGNSGGGSSEEISELSDRLDAEIERSTDKDEELETAIANTYTKSEVDQKIAEAEMGGEIPSGIVIDANYNHTDNNFTNAEKTKLAGIATGAEANVQADWSVTDTNSDAFIKNKPTKVSGFTNDAGYMTSYTETDPTVPAWAKAQTKPTYTASEVGAYTTTEVDNLISGISGGDTKEISVLWVGNSLTQDAVSYLPLVLKEIAPNLNFRFYIWYDGGATLSNILSKWTGNRSAEIFSTCENVTSWTNSSSTTMSAFLNSGKTFDVVSIEEYFNYKRETGYTAEAKADFNNIIEWLRNNYQHPFKVASFFHRPLCKNTSNTVDLSIADKVFGLTYDGIRWQMENTISETVIPTGISAYRAMYENDLTGIGSFGYMSADGTHSQEGLPCLMQAWVVALWLFEQMGMPLSINNAQTRVTSSNYSSINVPGANGSVVVGTTAQDRLAMNVAIKAYKEGKKLENGSLTPYGIPAYDIVINGLDGTKSERSVALSASFMPTDATPLGITWSIVSGNATVSNNGVVTYNGSDRTATVTVRASSNDNHLYSDGVLNYALNNVETPVISPISGEYSNGQTVTITCATPNATIYYTVDDTDPTNNSTQYTGAITLSGNTTVKAIAYYNGENSNIAIASYTIAVPRNVSIVVSDGTDPVTDATVTLTQNNVVFNPVSQSGGTYIFSVVDGTYNVIATKDNLEYQGQLIVGGDTTISIILEESALDILQDGAIVSPRLNLYGTAGQTNPTYNAVNGCSLITYNNSNRSCLLALRSETSHPCTWNSVSNAPNADKEFYTLYEINQEYPYIEISINEPYSFSVKLSDSDPDKGYWYNPYDAWVTRASLVLTPQSNPVYLTLQLRTGNNAAFSGVPTIEQMGLSIKAYKINPYA